MRKSSWPTVFIYLSLASLLIGLSGCRQAARVPLQSADTASANSPTVRTVEAKEADVKQFCGACHAYPQPATFPRDKWPEQIETAYGFFAESHLKLKPPPPEDVLAFYQRRAPEQLAYYEREKPTQPLSVAFQQIGYQLPPDAITGSPIEPAISNVSLAHLSSATKLDVILCDMHTGNVFALSPYEAKPRMRVLGKVRQPGHAEVADIDGDGIKDVLVADLGTLKPGDDKVGSVVILRGLGGGKYRPFTILKDIGRTCDIQMADFNGDGKQDLVVACFGWRHTGEIYYLENQTANWSQPKFVPHVVDPRHGTINVCVTDLNHDGKPDFVSLISQEHEMVVAYLNDGKGNFRKETLYRAPHPAFGSSGIQVVDFDGDGQQDVLYSNGDVFDRPPLLRPEYGITLLRNAGKFPFEAHRLTRMYGCERAVAAHVKGDKLMDVVGVSFLPIEKFPHRAEQDLDSLILLEQTSPGKFSRQVLETVNCNHFTCAAGDIFGTGRTDIVTANVDRQPVPAIVIWKNMGRNPKAKQVSKTSGSPTRHG